MNRVVCERSLTGKQTKYCSKKCNDRSRIGRYTETVEEKVCIHCGRLLPAQAYNKRTSNTTGLASFCRECASKYKTECHKAFKLKCVEYKGSACVNCGYDRHWAALQFHHTNPEEKLFEICDYKNYRPGQALPNIIKEELDKCVVVCANCHRIIHSGENNTGV